MRREGYIGVGIGVVCLLAVIGMIAIPGTIGTPDTDETSNLHIEEVTVSPGEMDGNTAQFQFGVAIGHTGGPGRDVEVTVRAIDSDSGLVADETTTAVGDISGDREQQATANLTVEREGGYEIKTILYADDRRVDAKQGSINGVDGLSSTSIAFKRYQTGIPTIEYSIEEVESGQTTLSVRTHIWNKGVQSADGGTLEIVARQSDSNVVADRTTVEVDQLASGEAVAPTAELTVPDGYGYHLDAILKHEGVIVSSATSVADLNPQREIDSETTFEDVNFSSEDFAQTPYDMEDRDLSETAAEESGPGFGVLSMVIALALAMVAVRMNGGRS